MALILCSSMVCGSLVTDVVVVVDGLSLAAFFGLSIVI